MSGTGKTTLARRTATQLHWPLLRIDDIVSFIPQAMLERADPFWETLIRIMLNLAEAQLEISVSVVIDSVFMGDDRQLARQIAAKHRVKFRPIYTYLSDETTWRERVEYRVATAPPPELYNLVEDPFEQHNLAEQYPAQVSRMLAGLETWFEAVETEYATIDD